MMMVDRRAHVPPPTSPRKRENVESLLGIYAGEGEDLAEIDVLIHSAEKYANEVVSFGHPDTGWFMSCNNRVEPCLTREPSTRTCWIIQHVREGQVVITNQGSNAVLFVNSRRELGATKQPKGGLNERWYIVPSAEENHYFLRNVAKYRFISGNRGKRENTKQSLSMADYNYGTDEIFFIATMMKRELQFMGKRVGLVHRDSDRFLGLREGKYLFLCEGHHVGEEEEWLVLEADASETPQASTKNGSVLFLNQKWRKVLCTDLRGNLYVESFTNLPFDSKNSWAVWAIQLAGLSEHIIENIFCRALLDFDEENQLLCTRATAGNSNLWGIVDFEHELEPKRWFVGGVQTTYFDIAKKFATKAAVKRFGEDKSEWPSTLRKFRRAQKEGLNAMLGKSEEQKKALQAAARAQRMAQRIGVDLKGITKMPETEEERALILEEFGGDESKLAKFFEELEEAEDLVRGLDQGPPEDLITSLRLRLKERMGGYKAKAKQTEEEEKDQRSKSLVDLIRSRRQNVHTLEESEDEEEEEDV